MRYHYFSASRSCFSSFSFDGKRRQWPASAGRVSLRRGPKGGVPLTLFAGTGTVQMDWLYWSNFSALNISPRRSIAFENIRWGNSSIAPALLGMPRVDTDAEARQHK